MEAGLEFETATRQTLARLRGASAIVVMNREQPDRIIAARLGNAGGITLGRGRKRDVCRQRYPRHPRTYAPDGLS